MKLFDIIQNPLLAPEFIRRWIVLTIGIVVAIVISFWIANWQLLPLGILTGVVLTVAVAVGLQRNAWLLILVGWYIVGSIYVLPVPTSIHDISIILATFGYIAYRVLIGSNARHPWGRLETLVAINCAYVAFTFALHPAGVRALGAETMGAKPYVNILLAFCAYWVIVHLPKSYQSVTKVPLWMMAGMVFVTMINLVVYIFPSTTRFILPFLGDIDTSGLFTPVAASGQSIRRFYQLGSFGLLLVEVLVAYYPPQTLFNPLRGRCYLFLIAIAGIFAGGFRSGLLFAMVAVVLASIFQRSWRQLVEVGIVGTLFVAALMFGQGRFFQLPLTAQRSLSFLPGQWDEDAKKEGNESTESRFEWWRTILSEGAIKNWWTGDGFGVAENDFNLLAYSGRTFDWFTITGTYHNGPLTTIRYAGLIGLVLYYAWTITAAVYSVKCLGRCRGSPLFPVAVFLAIQLVWKPVHYTFVYGSYESDVTQMLLLTGLLVLTLDMAERHPPSLAAPPTEPIRIPQPATVPRFALRPGNPGN
jgi:hypothetical protein